MARRRNDDPFGLANDRIMYDRTDPMEEEVPQMPLPEEEMMQPGLEEGMGAPPPPAEGAGMLAGLGAPAGPPAEPGLGTTDELSDMDLASLGAEEDVGTPEDIEVEQLEQMMADPNLSPQDRQIIEQQIALAARRRLAGVGGGGALGGLGA